MTTPKKNQAAADATLAAAIQAEALKPMPESLRPTLAAISLEERVRRLADRVVQLEELVETLLRARRSSAEEYTREVKQARAELGIKEAA